MVNVMLPLRHAHRPPVDSMIIMPVLPATLDAPFKRGIAIATVTQSGVTFAAETENSVHLLIASFTDFFVAHPPPAGGLSTDWLGPGAGRSYSWQHVPEG